MDAVIIYGIVILYLGATMYFANQLAHKPQQAGIVRALLYMGVFFLFLMGPYVLLLGLASAQIAAMGEDAVNDLFVPELGPGIVAVSFFLTLAAGSAGFAVVSSERARLAVQRLVGRYGSFDARSVVHTTAVVLILLILTGNTVLFLLEGGASSMAETIDAEGVPAGIPVFQAALQIVAAFLGVGFAIRRELPATLQRLGLRLPTRADLNWGLGLGTTLFGVLVVYGGIVAIFFSSEQLEAQNRAAESLAMAFSTLPLAMLLATSSAIGEEIFFRGALQPIFGNVLTSIFFTLLHSQVLLSPGILLIFVVSLGLGWLRQKHSTTAAIIAHFIYNFIQLMLVVILSGGNAQP
jgi:uncharacterized protein